MARIALISCTSSKKTYPCKASELYSESPRFRLAYELAKLVANRVYILSAKHGLVAENVVIEPYNETLKDKNSAERLNWSQRVLAELKTSSDTENDEYIIIAGEVYYENILQYLKKYWLPLKGKSLFEWITELKRLISIEETSNKAEVLHMVFNGLPRLNWTMIDRIPYQNGIYIIFEKGQAYYGMDRIVRVGTHKAQDRLRKRLKDHFFKEDANGSIFRKNIGRAFLQQVKDPYLKVWNLDTSKSSVAKANADLIDELKEKELEAKISSYLKENISFVCFPVETKEDRLRLEEGIISTLNNEPNFGPKGDWLGLSSSVPEIAASGLWNRQGLGGETLSNNELERIKCLTRFGMVSNNSSLVVKRKRRTPKPTVNRVTSKDVRKHINSLLQEAKLSGEEYLDLLSGQIHKQLGMKNSHATVCQVMYKIMVSGDQVLHTTPSGLSSTIKIRYYLKNH